MLWRGARRALILAAAAAAWALQTVPAAAAGEGKDWVDCVFGDESVGRVERKDCEAAGGVAQAPRLGPTIAYQLKVVWDGFPEPLLGTLMAPEYGLAGTLEIEFDEIDRRCTGEYRFPKAPSGVWAMLCNDGLSAWGKLHQASSQLPVVGTGEDSDGGSLMFQAWPRR